MAWRTGFKAAKHAKYGNKKAESNGIKFQSKKECARYDELILLQAAGLISKLKLQVTFPLQYGFTTIDGERIQPISYSCDFTYFETGIARRIVEDCKGFETAAFLKSWKQMKSIYPEYLYKIT